MDLIAGSQTALPARAWKAWRTRGAEYAWHKMLRRSLGRWPALETPMGLRRPPAILDTPRRR